MVQTKLHNLKWRVWGPDRPVHPALREHLRTHKFVISIISAEDVLV